MHLVAVFAVHPVAPGKSCGDDASELNLRRIYQGDDLKVRSTSLRWDAKDDVLWKKRTGEHPAIVRVDPHDLSSEVVVVSTDQLRVTPEATPLDVIRFDWSNDQSHLLVFTNAARVWRHHDRGDYWLWNVAADQWRRLGGRVAPQSLQHATFSQDGTSVAYVVGQSLMLEDVRTGQIEPIQVSESEDVFNGKFDWVYEEEFGLRRGYRFSPTGRFVAFWQIDDTDVSHQTLIDNTTDRYPKVTTFAYPKVGQTNPAAKIGVYDRMTKQFVWIGLPGDPRQNYLPAMDWVPADDNGESGRLLIQQLNRAQNELTLHLADAMTGRSLPLWRETSAGWIDPVEQVKFLKSQPGSLFRRLLWRTECHGWRQLVELRLPESLLSLPLDGATPLAATTRIVSAAVTAPGFDVIEIEHVDSENSAVLFTASPLNPAARGLYRIEAVDGDRSLAAVRVSPDTQGTYSYQVNHSGTWTIETWSDFETPSIQRLVKLNPYEVMDSLEENVPTREAIARLLPSRHSFLTLPIDADVQLDAWLMLPGDIDVNKPIPLVIHVYGEPAGQTVVDRYGGNGYLWHRYLNQLGYAVASIDNRGVNAPRGRSFRQAIHGKMGVLPASDQAAGLRVLLEKHPELDAERVAIWGWSGGGSNALHAIFRYPKHYAAAIAIAPVSDQRDYDTIYQERYQGLLPESRAAYEEGSPITYAAALGNPLLIVHGTGDDNVHYASTERLINDLVKHDRTFEMMAYPGRTHAISEGDGTTLHLRRLMTEFLQRHVPVRSKVQTHRPGDASSS